MNTILGTPARYLGDQRDAQRFHSRLHQRHVVVRRKVTVDADGSAALRAAPRGTLLSLGPGAQELQECERDG
jgi:hypothetical protein